MKRRMVPKTLALSVLLLVGSAMPGFAAEAQETMTLQQVLDEALTKNPTLVEGQKRWEEKKHRIDIVTAQPNPKLSIMKDDIPTTTINPGQAMMTEFSITQEFMHPAKLKAMGNMARREADMNKAIWSGKRIDVYAQTKQAYYDYLYSKQSLSIGKESQLLMGQLAKLAQVNYATGMVPLQDALKAQTEFSKMTSDLLNMASMEAVTKAKLNNLMGRNANIDFEVKEEFAAPAPQFDIDALVKEARANKPAILEMQSQVAMAKNGIDVAKKQQLPDFALSLGYKNNKEPMVEAQTDPMNPMNTTLMLGERKPTWKIEFMVMLPIWQGKNKAEVRSALANYEASQAALQNMQNMTELDVQMALTEVQVDWRLIELYQNTIIPQAEQTYQAAIVGYTNGKVDLMTVLEGVNTLRNAKLGHYKAKVDYEKAVVSLEKALGKPLASSLAPLS